MIKFSRIIHLLQATMQTGVIGVLLLCNLGHPVSMSVY